MQRVSDKPNDPICSKSTYHWSYPGPNVINKFQLNVTILCSNKAL